MTMLLFVRGPYYSAIRDGIKTFEVRAGKRYAGLKPGDELSINGRFRVKITDREVFHGARQTAQRLALTRFPVTESQINACYPDQSGPYYLLHFSPPSV